MSDFSTNFQFSIAQMGSLSKEQDKTQSVGKKLQEQMSNKIELKEQEHHSTVEAPEEKADATKVYDEGHSNDDNKENKKHQTKADATKDGEKILLLRDEEKGNIIDFSG